MQVVEEAVGEAAEAIAARKLVPLWPDKPLEGQPQVYSKIWQASGLQPREAEMRGATASGGQRWHVAGMPTAR